MTFLFSYIALGLIGQVMKRLDPMEAKPALRRLVTVAFFLMAPLLLIGAAVLIAPSLLRQGKQLAGWLSHVNPETEVARLTEGFIGPQEFKRAYSGPSDPQYQKDLQAFQATKVQHVKEYQEFPQLEAWVEGGFAKHFADVQSGKVRARLVTEGISSQDFEKWFITEKYPRLQKEAIKPSAGTEDPSKSKQLLDSARRDPAQIGPLRAEWINDTVKQETAPGSAVYLKEFQPYYDKQVRESPTAIPYTFAEYIELQKARSQGPQAFGAALEKLKPTKGDGQTSAARGFCSRQSTRAFSGMLEHQLDRQVRAPPSRSRLRRCGNRPPGGHYRFAA